MLFSRTRQLSVSCIFIVFFPAGFTVKYSLATNYLHAPKVDNCGLRKVYTKRDTCMYFCFTVETVSSAGKPTITEWTKKNLFPGHQSLFASITSHQTQPRQKDNSVSLYYRACSLIDINHIMLETGWWSYPTSIATLTIILNDQLEVSMCDNSLHDLAVNWLFVW